MTVSTKLRRSPSVPFSPSQLPNLGLWLKADSLALADAAAVATWADSSGNGNDATQATGGNRPTFETNEVNGLPIVRFVAASSHYLRADGLAASLTGTDLAVTVACVVKLAATTNYYTVFGGGHTSANGLFMHRISAVEGTAITFIKRDDAGSSGSTNTGAVDTNWHVRTIVLPGITVGAWLDGTNTTPAGSAFDFGATTINAVGIGAAFIGSSTPDQVFGGDIAELLVYTRALSDAERIQLERHLGAKYAVTVA